jgi:hypothetical protein
MVSMENVSGWCQWMVSVGHGDTLAKVESVAAATCCVTGLCWVRTGGVLTAS